MKNIILDFFLTVTGIGAASGLIYKDEHLYLISDNSLYLYDFSIKDQILSKIQLEKNSETLENIKKCQKPDFEAITFFDDKFYIYGSGSTQKRNHRITYKDEVLKEDFSAVYQTLQQKFDVDQENFNIEAVIHVGDEILLFNRGNGEKAQNGIFTVNLQSPEKDSFHRIELPSIDNVQTGFTDAILVDDAIYFIAAAEDSKSNYLDGEIAGTILGKMSLNNFSALETSVIPGKHKFEGITLKDHTATNISFLLCEDRDDDKTETIIYSLTIDK